MADCKAVVKVDAGNVRAEARTGTAVVGIVHRDDELPVNSVSEPDSGNFRWINITIPTNQQRGWIREDLVQLSGDCEGLGVVTTTPEVLPVGTAEKGSTTSSGSSSSSPLSIPGGSAIGMTNETNENDTVLVGDCLATVKVFLARVRSLPDKTGTTLGMLPRNTQFTVTGISEEDGDGLKWYSFDYQGQAAWTREDLVMVTGDCMDFHSHDDLPVVETPVTTPVETPPTVDSSCVGLIAIDKVNVRVAPSASANLAGQAVKGESFAVLDITDLQADGFNWVKIDFNGKEAYLRFDLIGLQGNCRAMLNDDRLLPPVATRVSQGYHENHRALDFPIPSGTQMCCEIPGVVIRSLECMKCTGNPPTVSASTQAERDSIFNDAGWGYGYGHHIIVRHKFSDVPASTQQAIFAKGGNSSDFVFVLYAHLSRRDVENNAILKAKDKIGITGHTGYSTAPHLHLEVAYGPTWERARKIHPSTLFLVENRLGV